MNIVLVVPDEPFYVANNLDYLIRSSKKKYHIRGCILLSPTPYGKRNSFLDKFLKTLKIFGFKFVIYYGFKFIFNKIFKSSVKNVLKKNEIPIIRLQESLNTKKSLDIISKLKPDVIISILGNEIFKTSLLNLPTFGCINLHTSMLPKYRGMMPTFWVLLNKERETGVTVFKMDEGIDSGPILAQEKVKIDSKFSQQDLIIKTKRIGMSLILETLNMIAENSIRFIENDVKKSSYFSYPTRKDVKLFKLRGNKFF